MTDTPTEEGTTTPAEPVAADATAPAPVAQQIDEQVLAQNITSSVTENVSQSVQAGIDEKIKTGVAEGMNEAFRRMAGEEVKQEPHELHKAFAKTPAALFEQNRNLAKEEVIRELKAEQVNERECVEVLNPVYAKTPVLKKYSNEVRADFDTLALLDENRNKSDAQILEQSLKRTVERLGLEELSDEEVARNAALPPASGSGYPQGSPAPVDSDQAAADFISQGRARFRSLRVPKAN